jgi:cholest-4-en-3-one 26-monooxygenase
MSAPALPEGFDITDPDLIEQRVPLEELAELRRMAPVWWNASPPGYGFDDGGFWVISRHADVRDVSMKPEIFSSWANGAVIRFMRGISREEIDMQRVMLLNQDPPDHTKLRRILSRGFTPRAIRMIEDALAVRAERIAREAVIAGSGDFVAQVACELPLQAIAELIGVPQEERARIFSWSNQMLAYDDPELSADPSGAAVEIIAYAAELGQARIAAPRDDMVTTLVRADVDGQGLSADEFAFFVILLAVAGNETTRNAITHGMMAFLEFPDQWDRYRAERPATAIDEIVRWSTPVMTFQRTALVDTVVGGVDIRAGQRLALSYSSANFDPDAFDHPEQFDITRDPNPHLGFGGGGPHYCLGANLAKVEIRLMFSAIADHMPEISLAGPSRRLRSSWINGIKALPVRYHP